MVTYTLIEISALCDTMEMITGCSKDYPIVEFILEDLKKSGTTCDIDTLVRNYVGNYFRLSGNIIPKKVYDKMGVDRILYDEPFSSMPLYLNCEGSEILKKVAATWRLMIGK